MPRPSDDTFTDKRRVGLMKDLLYIYCNLDVTTMLLLLLPLPNFDLITPNTIFYLAGEKINLWKN